MAKKEEAAERLAAEYQRRMALLKTKEDLEKARNRIFGSGRRSVRDMIVSPFSPTHRATADEVRVGGCRGARYTAVRPQDALLWSADDAACTTVW